MALKGVAVIVEATASCRSQIAPGVSLAYCNSEGTVVTLTCTGMLEINSQ